jgi:hypothetical protein
MYKIVIPIVVAAALALAFAGCKLKPSDPGNEFTNIRPNIYLVNVPWVDTTDVIDTTGGVIDTTVVRDTTDIEHVNMIYWYGTDIDGYIVQYEWSVTRDTPGATPEEWNIIWTDSTEYEVPTQDTIAFPCPYLDDRDYYTIFWVTCLDDEGAYSDTAKRVFRTSNIPPCSTSIETGPEENDTLFVLFDTTGTWSGFEITWETTDPDEYFLPQFRWAWDDTSTWSEWSEETGRVFWADTSDTILAPLLDTLATTGEHTFYLQARDDALVIDTTVATLTIYGVMPTFERKVLFIDETSPSPNSPEAEVDAFYDRILRDSGWDFDTVDVNMLSGLDQMGQYLIVYYVSDDISPGALSASTTEKLQAYLDAGGRVFISGAQMATTLINSGLATSYFGIEGNTVNSGFEFIGCIMQDTLLLAEGYPEELEIDTTKTLLNRPERSISMLDAVREDLVTYRWPTDPSINQDFWGKPVGTRAASIYGTFRTSFIDVPFYRLMPEEDVAAAVKTTLDYLGE